MAAFDPLRDRVLRLLRVPPAPEPPAGAPGSVRVFRAGRNFYKLKLAAWALGQIGALVGILFSLGFLHHLEDEVEEYREAQRRFALSQAKQRAAAKAATAQPAAVVVDPSSPAPATAPTAVEPAQPGEETKGTRRDGKQRPPSGLGRIIDRSPWWVFPLIRFAEYAGIIGYLLQIPITYAMVRLDWEQRWYIVTDRSLRIRTGLATVLESTMSFANIQQVVVTQGPAQRYLGLADVRVQSAGGGGGTDPGDEPSLHTGIFHGVEHAREIRDLILERLRRFRQAGLGDPDDPHAGHPGPADPEDQPAQAVAAAQELLAEARALRAALTRT